MITYRQGNLLDANAEALVNTVNTVGVMGKGIALMFRDAFPENFRLYKAACKAGEVRVGQMFVTEVHDILRPQLKYIVNFPTKQHWRSPSTLQWVVDGLSELRALIVEKKIRSIAIPPLGSGNGGLEWPKVRLVIEAELSKLPDVVDIQVFEPARQYQNVAKRSGVEKLTPVRALLAELVRRYWVVAMSCSLLEVQKLAYLLEREIDAMSLAPLGLRFAPERYGPYDDRLRHVLDGLDGSYLHCERRLSDASPLDLIWFDDSKTDLVAQYLRSETTAYEPALRSVSSLIAQFESPLGMELLATVDYMMRHGLAGPTVQDVRRALPLWPGGVGAGERKLRLFDERLIDLALERLTQHGETVRG